jgi:uncharacterized protein YecT (DUF1311 family)
VMAAAVAPTGPGQARAASFNCARAATPTEVAICANPTLSALDGELGLAYTPQLASMPAVKQVERGWMAVRNIACGRDGACLTRFTSVQLAWLRSGAPRPPSAIPTRIGACSLTALSQVGTRLGTPGSGSAVSEANGASQVSYDQVPAIDASRPGDPALICLASVPRGCPPGDDRGKIYGVANLRTLGAWAQPDSEHSCGGA